jgi:signal transduction histidine kinase/ligand-binding sensor domain-containing protein
LKNSNSCLDESGNARQGVVSCRPRWALVLLAAGFLVSTAYAIDPNRAMSQYIHDKWGSERGFPGGQVYAITQTSDGYLWIGGQNGLVRFDGLNFRPFQHAKTPSPAPGPVLGLTGDVKGNLWIQQQTAGLLRYHVGVFDDALPEFGRTQSSVTAMCRGSNGEIVISARSRGIFTYNGEEFLKTASDAGGLSVIVISMAEGPQGEIWMGTDSGLFALKNGVISPGPKELADRKINCLLPVGSQELWVGTDNGVLRWTNVSGTWRPLAPILGGDEILAMIRDRDSNTWAGTTKGLFRITPEGVVSMDTTASGTSAVVTALFEDREGNVWVGGTQGLQSLRDSAFTTYSASEGMPSDNNGSVYVDSDGRTWFAPLQGGLYRMSKGKVERVTEAGLAGDVIYSITGRNNELWIGRQRGGLTHLFSKGSRLAAETFTQPNGLAQNSVYAVYQSRDGTVWAGTLSGGVSRYSGGKFTTYTATNGLASNTVTSILEGSDGAMLFATPSGLSVLTKEGWSTYTEKDGLPLTVNCLFQDSAGTIWAGAPEGLAFFNGGRFQVPKEPAALHEEILGIAEDTIGSLWVATSNHVLRVKRDKLLRGGIEDSDIREFGFADGLHGVEGVKRQRSVVTGPLGRIWFSMNRGLSVVDPARQLLGSAPALVDIQTVSADSVAIDPRGPIDVPVGSQRITFSFAGLSLSIPERTRFRYMLDGFDHGWSEPVASREAVYTNLGPGRYRFHVMASNGDGQWNSDEAAISFEIEPRLWQTFWFQLCCLFAAAVAVFALYRLRLFQMARQLNGRFEERLAERTLIAQELHDTLLAGFLSASMQLHVACDRVSPDSPAKPALNRVLQLMGQVIEEGRNAVRGLRSTSNDSLELGKAFSRIPEELGVEESGGFRVVVEGRATPLHPLTRDEVYRIGREAVVNAFRHSRAKSIEIEVEYSVKHLRVLIRDDGCGIDPQVLQSGREGHWGLPGMRERAEGIGARLRVWSRTAAGTEVELLVPAHIAFQNPAKSGRLGWAVRLYSKMARVVRGKPGSEREK